MWGYRPAMENERKNDPAFQAVEEAGGGEAEGFEQAEEDLVNNAENAERYASAKTGDAALESEEDPGATYGEADHEPAQGEESVPDDEEDAGGQ